MIRQWMFLTLVGAMLTMVVVDMVGGFTLDLANTIEQQLMEGVYK